MKGVLGKHVGPFPVVGWLGIVAAGGAIGLGVKRGFAGTPAADPAATDVVVDPALSPAVYTGTGGGGGYAGLPADKTPTNTGPASVLLETNDQWTREAIRQLIGRGFVPALVDGALRKYVAGDALTPAEISVVESALMSVGIPPEPVPPMLNAAPLLDAPAVTPADRTPTAPSPVIIPPMSTVAPPPAEPTLPAVSLPPPPTPTPQPMVGVQPVYAGQLVSADIFTGSQPGAVLGVPAGSKWLGDYSEKEQQTLLAGKPVNGKTLVPGTNYAR